MPPRTKDDDGSPWTYGLKLRTNAGSPDPVATRHLCAWATAPVPAVGAANALAPASMARPSVRTTAAAARSPERTRVFIPFPVLSELDGARGAPGTLLDDCSGNG